MTGPRPRRKRRTLGRRVLVLASLGAAFVVGIGVGEALHDRPATGGGQTIVRTLEPLRLAPLPAETVTVTTSNR